MKSRAQRWWDATSPESRTVATMREAVKMARVELVYLLQRAKHLKDAYLLDHGIKRSDLIAEIKLASEELRWCETRLALVPQSIAVSSLPWTLTRAVELETDPAHRKAQTDASRSVTTPLIDWPGRILTVLGTEEQEREQQTWAKLAEDVAKEAAELAPTSTNAGMIALIAAGGVIAVLGVVGVAVALSSRR